MNLHGLPARAARFLSLAVVVAAASAGCAAGELPGPEESSVPLPTPSASFPNQPAGMAPSLELDMTSKTLGTGAAYSQGWLSVNVSLASDGSAPKSPPSVLEYIYNIGFTDQQGSPGFADKVLPGGPKQAVYIAFWIHISKPWEYHVTGVNKIFFVGTNQLGASHAEFVCSVIGAREATAQFRCGVQAPSNTSTGTANGYYTANMATPGFSLGVWHRVELVLERNIGGQPNGVMKWWVDGTLVGSHTNVNYNSTGDAAFEAISLNPNWGGNAQQLKTERDVIKLDHFFVSGR